MMRRILIEEIVANNLDEDPKIKALFDRTYELCDELNLDVSFKQITKLYQTDDGYLASVEYLGHEFDIKEFDRPGFKERIDKLKVFL